jgi:hypothetical protein
VRYEQHSLAKTHRLDVRCTLSGLVFGKPELLKKEKSKLLTKSPAGSGASKHD